MKDGSGGVTLAGGQQYTQRGQRPRWSRIRRDTLASRRSALATNKTPFRPSTCFKVDVKLLERKWISGYLRVIKDFKPKKMMQCNIYLMLTI